MFGLQVCLHAGSNPKRLSSRFRLRKSSCLLCACLVLMCTRSVLSAVEERATIYFARIRFRWMVHCRFCTSLKLFGPPPPLPAHFQDRGGGVSPQVLTRTDMTGWIARPYSNITGNCQRTSFTDAPLSVFELLTRVPGFVHFGRSDEVHSNCEAHFSEILMFHQLWSVKRIV